MLQPNHLCLVLSFHRFLRWDANKCICKLKVSPNMDEVRDGELRWSYPSQPDGIIGMADWALTRGKGEKDEVN